MHLLVAHKLPFVAKDKLEVEQEQKMEEHLEAVNVQTEVHLPEEYDLAANSHLDMGSADEEGLAAFRSKVVLP